ncbi:MAG TPA: DUF692 domain-containing protein [Coxiellaceae bacterium]|nr:DUF692 domain-containing protein [Coxiellaceae bacterium]
MDALEQSIQAGLSQEPCLFLGFGIGLRPCHYQTILDHCPPDIDWFEIVSEDYMVPGGTPLHYLDAIAERFPIVMHGVSLSIGSVDPLNAVYLKDLKRLRDRIKPRWISDHLCWTGVDGYNTHDLLPLPYTESCLMHVAERVDQVQNFLGEPLILENPSSYVSYTQSTMSEWEFLTRLVEKTRCEILLDINNIYVSSFNHNFNAQDYLKGVPSKAVKQFHLAGHKHCSNYIIDTHDQPVIEEVWKLYHQAIQYFPNASILIERDDQIPPLEELVEELKRAKKLYCNAYEFA